MTKIIGLTGYIGSGKSTIANALILQLRQSGMRADRIGFAEPMRDMMMALLRKIMTPGDAREVLTTQEGKARTLKALERRGITVTPRHMMQTLGTEWGRESLHPEFWAQIGMIAALRSNLDVVIFDDVRFNNEASAIIDEHGVIYEIVRPGVERSSAHKSEDGIRSDFITGMILNDDTPEAVAKRIHI